LVLAELFKVEEEERTVVPVVELRNLYRPAERKSVVVAAQDVSDVAAAAVVGEGRARVQRFVT
jgi:hypothetical protein